MDWPSARLNSALEVWPATLGRVILGFSMLIAFALKRAAYLAYLRARKVVFSLRSSVSRRALRYGVGACVEHGVAFVGRDFRTIVDVGANRGQFSLFSHIRFPKARIISFEPQPEPAALFRKVFEGVQNISLHPIAVGEASSQMDLHVTAQNDSSSLLRIGSRQRDEFGTAEVGVIKVDVRRLDEVISDADLVSPSLLKLDVQGFEGSVLRGCGTMLRKFDAVYLEGSYKELYEGQVLIGELTAYLVEQGFAVAGEFNLATDHDGQPLQADFLFVNGAKPSTNG